MKNFNITLEQAYPFDRLICIKIAGVKNILNTKIEINYNKIERMNGLDDLANPLSRKSEPPTDLPRHIHRIEICPW